jgi:hypothetical protein
MDARFPLDLPKRPAQAVERENLLLFVVRQDVAHVGGGP